jgi:hypothetical protein
MFLTFVPAYPPYIPPISPLYLTYSPLFLTYSPLSPTYTHLVPHIPTISHLYLTYTHLVPHIPTLRHIPPMPHTYETTGTQWTKALSDLFPYLTITHYFSPWWYTLPQQYSK